MYGANAAVRLIIGKVLECNCVCDLDNWFRRRFERQACNHVDFMVRIVNGGLNCGAKSG